jgi:hypothetical protein
MEMTYCAMCQSVVCEHAKKNDEMRTTKDVFSPIATAIAILALIILAGFIR